MELTSEHRQALLTLLDETNAALTLSKKCLDRATEETGLYPMFQIDCFIQEQTIELIKKSLIDNTIDF